MLPATQRLSSLIKKKKDLEASILKLQKELSKVNKEHDELFMCLTEGVPPRAKKTKGHRVICLCPSDNCRGYILDDHTCGICNTKICQQCNVILCEGHTCKIEDIKSVALIRKECKACPSCGVPSRKTEGCSQVWCMCCHKAWNWNTSKIETGRIHATDYLDYVRKNYDAVDFCMPLSIHMSMKRAQMKFEPAKAFLKNKEDFLTYRYQVAVEYIEHLRDRLTPPCNLDLRLKYLDGEIDETKLKQSLFKRDKEFSLKVEIHKMRCTYTTNMNDITACLYDCATFEEFSKLIDSMYELHDVMVKEYKALIKSYNSRKLCPFIRLEER